MDEKTESVRGRRKKDGEKTRTIGILLLVLLVLLITFFGLKKWNTSKSEAEEKKKENAVVHIFETDSLESIEYKEASGEEMSFVKEDDTWEYAPDTTIALTESSMQNMEDAFSDIQAVKRSRIRMTFRTMDLIRRNIILR